MPGLLTAIAVEDNPELLHSDHLMVVGSVELPGVKDTIKIATYNVMSSGAPMYKSILSKAQGCKCSEWPDNKADPISINRSKPPFNYSSIQMISWKEKLFYFNNGEITELVKEPSANKEQRLDDVGAGLTVLDKQTSELFDQYKSDCVNKTTIYELEALLNPPELNYSLKRYQRVLNDITAQINEKVELFTLQEVDDEFRLRLKETLANEGFEIIEPKNENASISELITCYKKDSFEHTFPEKSISSTASSRYEAAAYLKHNATQTELVVHNRHGDFNRSPEEVEMAIKETIASDKRQQPNVVSIFAGDFNQGMTNKSKVSTSVILSGGQGVTEATSYDGILVSNANGGFNQVAGEVIDPYVHPAPNNNQALNTSIEPKEPKCHVALRDDLFLASDFFAGKTVKTYEGEISKLFPIQIRPAIIVTDLGDNSPSEDVVYAIKRNECDAEIKQRINDLSMKPNDSQPEENKNNYVFIAKKDLPTFHEVIEQHYSAKITCAIDKEIQRLKDSSWCFLWLKNPTKKIEQLSLLKSDLESLKTASADENQKTQSLITSFNAWKTTYKQTIEESRSRFFTINDSKIMDRLEESLNSKRPS